MAIQNSIDLITKYSTKAWDKVYKAEAVSSLLDASENNVKWMQGSKTVKIAKFSAGGLGNYYRNNNGDPRVTSGTDALDFGPFGYPTSSVGLTWEEFTIKCDRSARYPVELFDNEESDGLVLGASTTEISRTIMIPEIDAYCFSTLAKYIKDAGVGNYVTSNISSTTDGSNGVETVVFEALNNALVYMEEHEVPADKQIIFVSPRFMNRLRASTITASRLLQNDMSNDVKFTIQKYEGRDIVVVPPERFKTDIDLSGSGVHWKSTSKYIDFMVVAKDAVMHVVKYNKVKIIGGDANLAGANFDGWSIFARVYHDVFVPDNKVYALYAHVSTDGAYASQATPKLSIVAEDGVVTKIVTFPSEKRFVVAGGSTEKAAIANALAFTNVLHVGDTLTASTTYVAVSVDDIANGKKDTDLEGKVAKFTTE